MKSNTEAEAEELIEDLKPGERIVKKPPHGGYLFLEHNVPFLIICRNIPNDKATLRLARTGASYLIVGKDHFDYFQEFANETTIFLCHYIKVRQMMDFLW